MLIRHVLASGVAGGANPQQRSDVFTALQHVMMAEAALLIAISPAMTPLSEVQKEAERTALASLAANAQVAAALHLSETSGRPPVCLHADVHPGLTPTEILERVMLF
eukprot:scaffold673644_cov93-Prasinocladus_malaysianus.AAC.1